MWRSIARRTLSSTACGSFVRRARGARARHGMRRAREMREDEVGVGEEHTDCGAAAARNLIAQRQREPRVPRRTEIRVAPLEDALKW